MSDLREQVTALLNANCYDGCESGADEMRACVFPPCPCRTLADSLIALVLEEAAKVAEDCSVDLNGTYAAIHIAAAIRALKEKIDD